MLWKDDDKHLATMKEQGISHTCECVSVSKIDWKASEVNIGRLNRPLDHEKIEDFVTIKRNGAVFPKAILAKDGDKYTIVAGLHRSEADRDAGCESIECYVVRLRFPYEFKMLAVGTNRKEGDRISRNQAVEHAVDMVVNDNLDPSDVANKLSISVESIQRKLRIRETAKQCADAGCKYHLTDEAYQRLSPLKVSDNVLSAAADVVGEYKMTGQEVADFVKQLKPKRNEAQKIAAIEEHAASLRKLRSPTNDKGIAPPIKLPVRTTFLRLFHGLETVTDGKSTITDLQIEGDSDDHKDLKKRWQAMRTKIDAIIGKSNRGLDKNPGRGKH